MFVSIFRRGSAPVLVCGGLLAASLFATGLYLTGAVCVLLVCCLSGALHRLGTHRLERPHAELCSTCTSSLSLAKPAVPAAELAGPSTFAARLQAVSTREHAPGEPTALVLIAVNALDQVEEQAGGVAAEVAMLTLLSALRRALPRQSDLLEQYSRSTFAVLLQGTDLSGSLRVAARLRWAITRLGIASAHTSSGFLTTSIGVAVHHDLPLAGPNALIQAAEQTLEAARQSGHDGLEYQVAGLAPAPGFRPNAAVVTLALPAIRAWTVERSPHSSPVA